MKKGPSALFRRLRPPLPTCVAAAVLLVAGLPASAARPTASSTSGDPFTKYNAKLNAAASQTLKRIGRSAIPMRKANAADRISLAPPSLPDARRTSRLALERVNRLLPVIGPILKRAGVPVQLAAVVLVESGGNPTALSPKGARGLWQLMPETAREYGLIVNGKIDQRLDVIKSTRAAAEYLRDLYAEFHNWKLALAAYNAGDQAVHKAMARTGADAFATASRALPRETQSYVPAVLHALSWFGGNALSPPTKRADLQQIAYATGE